MTQKIIFGTDGWRALLGSEFNMQSVGLVAQAFADYCRYQGYEAVVLGYDGRQQSGDFARMFANILQNNGLESLLSHTIVPTPVVSFHCARLGLPGVMITASHNPPQYNGIKFKSPAGSPFFTEETAKVEDLVGRSHVRISSATPPVTNLIEAYLVHLEQSFDLGTIRKSGIRVAIDSMHGAGGSLLEQLLKKHQIDAQTIAAEPLADFGGRLAEPAEANLQPLCRHMKATRFGIGLATDGDADRLGVVDNQGRYVNIQQVILALASYVKLHRQSPGPLVKTASVADKLRRLVPDDQVIDVQVGFKYVAEAMMENGACFGAEESGGFGFGGHLPERDGIYSGLMMLEMLASNGFADISEYLGKQKEELGEICYSRIDWHNHNEQRHGVLASMYNLPPATVAGFAIDKMTPYKSSRGIINGLKIRLEGLDRWLLLRVSETEPMVRIYAEGQSDSEVQQLLAEGKSLFENLQNELKTL
ncbi:MAG: phosphoglucomutase [Bacteroidetes bacterium]|nr:phosphoglucomutase [Bacteroidota bacterium]